MGFVVLCLPVSAGTKPECTVGCPDCLVQSPVPAYSTVTIKTLSCPVGQAVAVRKLLFTPWCQSAKQCSSVSLALSFLPAAATIFGTDANGCFRQTDPRVMHFQETKAAIRTASITVTCHDAVPCSYASIVDVFCQDYLAGHSASGQSCDLNNSPKMKQK